MFKPWSAGTNGPKCAKKICPTPSHHHTTTSSLNRWYKAGRIHAFMLSDHLNAGTEIETHQTREHFSKLLLFNFGESVWIVASEEVFCCCRTSILWFQVLCVQRCSSVYLSCNKWLFELQLSFYHFEPVLPFSSDLWYQWGIFIHTTAAADMFS